MKVSEKGAVSIYGMGRFRVTLYKEQWLKLLDVAAEIRAFIAANVHGYDEFMAASRTWTVERAADVCGLSAKDIRTLAAWTTKS